MIQGCAQRVLGRFACLCVLGLLVTGCGDSSDAPEPTPGKRENLPAFGEIQNVREKKTAFFEYMNARVKVANDDVWNLRMWVIDQRARFESGDLTPKEQQAMLDLAADYAVTSDVLDDQVFENLLTRVDIVPAPLVLAQAANESGWGSSRFSREGRNFFGVWCYEPGCGITPARRNAGATHEVRRYDNTLESVQHYLHTVNTGAAYAKLREARAAARAEGVPPRGSRWRVG